jgi:hypothetical protein
MPVIFKREHYMDFILKDKITVTKMNITSDHTYFLGGTQELYAIADTGVDAVWIYKNNNRLFVPKIVCL